MSSRHYLYFFTDVNDTVIYVGITNNMESRINQHFGRSGHLEAKAYEEVVTIHHAEFPCKNEAVIYETYYISKLQPKFNTMMKNDGLVGFDLPYPEIKKNHYTRPDSTERNSLQNVYRTVQPSLRTMWMKEGNPIIDNFFYYKSRFNSDPEHEPGTLLATLEEVERKDNLLKKLGDEMSAFLCIGNEPEWVLEFARLVNKEFMNSYFSDSELVALIHKESKLEYNRREFMRIKNNVKEVFSV